MKEWMFRFERFLQSRNNRRIVGTLYAGCAAFAIALLLMTSWLRAGSEQSPLRLAFLFFAALGLVLCRLALGIALAAMDEPSFVAGLSTFLLSLIFGMMLLVGLRDYSPAIGVGWMAASALLFWASSHHYNLLIRLFNMAHREDSGIAVLVKRRFDLIDRMVAIADSFRIHERDVLLGIAEARRRMEQTDSPQVRAEAEAAVNNGVARVIAIAEAYPILKYDQNAGRLMQELVDTENGIASARSSLLNAVNNYNTQRVVVPHIFSAALFGFPRLRAKIA